MKLVTDIENLREQIADWLNSPVADSLTESREASDLLTQTEVILASVLDHLLGPRVPVLVEEVNTEDVEYPGCHLPLASLEGDATCPRCGYLAKQHLAWQQTQNYRNRFTRG